MITAVRRGQQRQRGYGVEGARAEGVRPLLRREGLGTGLARREAAGRRAVEEVIDTGVCSGCRWWARTKQRSFCRAC